MIHHSVVLDYSGGPIEMPWDVEIGPFCHIVGPVRFGSRVKVSGHVVIGTPGEHKSRGPAGVVTICDDVVIREFSIVHRGTGDRDTTIGERCWIMDHGHVAHDCVLEPDVTLSPNVTLGGHTRVHQGATIGIGAMTHQHTTVGAYAMIGMGSIVTKDVPPFALVAGNPARYMRENTHGIERASFEGHPVQVEDYEITFQTDRREGRGEIRKP